MRAIACSLIVGLFPGVSLAETLEFSFTGFIQPDFPDSPFPPNIWNGPGPVPSTFQMTFDVNTLDSHNSLSYTFADSGMLFSSISADLVATNFILSVDGKTVPSSTSGNFGFSGTGLGGCCLYIGGGLEAGNDKGSFITVPDFGLPGITQAEFLASSDPLGLLLNGSPFFTDNGCCGFFFFDSSQLNISVSGMGTAASVPEPNTLALLALAGIGLGLAHRRRIPCTAARLVGARGSIRERNPIGSSVRILFALFAVFGLGAAQATDFEFDLRGQAFLQSSPAGPFDVMFTVDTQSGELVIIDDRPTSLEIRNDFLTVVNYSAVVNGQLIHQVPVTNGLAAFANIGLGSGIEIGLGRLSLVDPEFFPGSIAGRAREPRPAGLSLSADEWGVCRT